MKHKGVIKIQSFTPETHCTSLLGSTFSASDVARCVSDKADLSSIFESKASSWFCEGGGCSGEAGREDAIVDMQREASEPGIVVFMFEVMKAWPSRVGDTTKL